MVAPQSESADQSIKPQNGKECVFDRRGKTGELPPDCQFFGTYLGPVNTGSHGQEQELEAFIREDGGRTLIPKSVIADFGITEIHSPETPFSFRMKDGKLTEINDLLAPIAQGYIERYGHKVLGEYLREYVDGDVLPKEPKISPYQWRSLVVNSVQSQGTTHEGIHTCVYWGGAPGSGKTARLNSSQYGNDILGDLGIAFVENCTLSENFKNSYIRRALENDKNVEALLIYCPPPEAGARTVSRGDGSRTFGGLSLENFVEKHMEVADNMKALCIDPIMENSKFVSGVYDNDAGKNTLPDTKSDFFQYSGENAWSFLEARKTNDVNQVLRDVDKRVAAEWKKKTIAPPPPHPPPPRGVPLAAEASSGQVRKEPTQQLTTAPLQPLPPDKMEEASSSRKSRVSRGLDGLKNALNLKSVINKGKDKLKRGG